jgi:hypothetical protein
VCSGEIEPETDVRIELSCRITMAHLLTKTSTALGNIAAGGHPVLATERT